MDYIKDKSWMDKSRVDEEYAAGVEAFLNLAFANSNFTNGTMIECPCKNCHGMYLQNRDTTHEHLICDGFMKDYRTFYLHGESPQRLEEAMDGDEDDVMDDMLGLLDDALGTANMDSIPIDPTDEASGCNKSNAKRMLRCTLGTVPIAQVGWKMEQVSGSHPSRTEVFGKAFCSTTKKKEFPYNKKVLSKLKTTKAKHQAAHESQPENEVIEVVSIDDLSFVEVLGPEVKNRMRGMGYGARCNDVFTPVGRHRRQAITSMQIRMDDMERARKDDELRRRELELELREKNIRIQELELENRRFREQRDQGQMIGQGPSNSNSNTPI